MIKAPVRYYGGKGSLLKPLLAQFPKEGSYSQYYELFGGSGVVLLNKPVVPVEVYNDLDNNVYSLMLVLQSPTLFIEFQRLAELSLYSESVSDQFKEDLKCPNLSTVDRAYKFWYVNRTRYNGVGGFSVNTWIRRGTSKAVSDMLSSVDNLGLLHSRLSNVIVTRQDALKMLRDLDRPDTMVYLDPPYHWGTRTGVRYPVDMTPKQHFEMIETVNGFKHGMVLISGYDNPAYDALKLDKVLLKDTKKPEYIWRNYGL